MDSYTVKKEYLGIKEGTIISPKDGKYEVTVDNNTIEISKSNINNTEFFEKSDAFSIEEIEEDDSKKKYRVQIDINCTEEKRKEIETFLRSNLNKILE